MIWRAPTLVVAAVTACLMLPAGALALNPVVADCYAHTVLTKHYTIPQLQQAVNNVPADIAEYTNCPNVISEQLDTQLAAIGAGGGSGAGSSSFVPVWLIVMIALIVLAGGGATIRAWYSSRPGGGKQPPPGTP
jgi:hypothetical protein